jgi:hypothetical protein
MAHQSNIDISRCWYVQLIPEDPAKWIVIADSREEAKDMAESLKAKVSFDVYVDQAWMSNGRLAGTNDLCNGDSVILAHPERDDVAIVSDLEDLLAKQQA